MTEIKYHKALYIIAEEEFIKSLPEGSTTQMDENSFLVTDEYKVILALAPPNNDWSKLQEVRNES
jgi:hypothetical protein